MQKHYYLKRIRKVLILNGIWPLQLKGIANFFYDCLFYTLLIFACVNIVTVYITAEQVILHGTSAEIAECIANTVFATLQIIKALTYRSKGVRNLIDFILQREENIFNSLDATSQDIYKKNCASANRFGFTYIAVSMTMSFLAQIFPLTQTLFTKPDENGHKEKYFIVPNWEPFDKYEYYYTTYVIHFFYTLTVESYIVFCGTFFIILLRNISAQLLVLQYRFKSIYQESLKRSQKNDITLKNASDLILHDCIKSHQKIISLMYYMDKVFGKYMFLEYIFTSFGLSMVVLQFLLQKTIQLKIAAVGFFIVFASQSLVIYYHADDVAWESSYGLTEAIFSGDWYELDKYSQKMLVFVVKRAQKPLTLSIGPFKKVGVDSMIALFKATYSFLSVMWR